MYPKPPAPYRSDPGWIQAWETYVADDLPGTADERLKARCAAVAEMYRIEMTYPKETTP